VNAIGLQTLSRAETAALGAVGLLCFLGIWSFLSLSGIVIFYLLTLVNYLALRRWHESALAAES